MDQWCWYPWGAKHTTTRVCGPCRWMTVVVGCIFPERRRSRPNPLCIAGWPRPTRSPRHARSRSAPCPLRPWSRCSLPATDLGSALAALIARCWDRPTYPQWEWVIVDDSGDDGVGLSERLGPGLDPRVHPFFSDRHRGYIGTIKRLAATLCRGEILVELDHDDELTPDCLQRLVAAFRRHPAAGFAYGEAAEIYEASGASHWYGWDAGFGYLSYWRQYDGVTGRTVNVPRTPGTNWQTVRHLVGLPNHPRAWTREAYFAVGGHRPGLLVADDYDLILRSLLCTSLVRVPHLLYLQYRNAGGENQTFVRNR
ncbi:MAG: glycosyltransferase, partial [Gammaproteobacteria bacterium]|nr:glycosyltransferase [Gammaproteobacteria bacterium]